MKYPTLEEINYSDRITIARWYRYLPFPGTDHIGKKNFIEMRTHEIILMNRINERFEELGGMTPELSKIIKH